jgi:hypothetical protein
VSGAQVSVGMAELDGGQGTGSVSFTSGFTRSLRVAVGCAGRVGAAELGSPLPWLLPLGFTSFSSLLFARKI